MYIGIGLPERGFLSVLGSWFFSTAATAGSGCSLGPSAGTWTLATSFFDAQNPLDCLQEASREQIFATLRTGCEMALGELRTLPLEGWVAPNLKGS